nr:hypothetical protein [uncultured Psychroserpens sp.]
MKLGKYNIKQKQIYFKAFPELSKLENALKQLKEQNTSLFQVSILGKISQFPNDKDIESFKDIAIIKSYWKNILGRTVNFGTFYNPESGFIFIVGPLVTTFLHKINGKSLATLSSGTYGIFRGIGVSDTQATTYLKLLSSGSYLLIFRGIKMN